MKVQPWHVLCIVVGIITLTVFVGLFVITGVQIVNAKQPERQLGYEVVIEELIAKSKYSSRDYRPRDIAERAYADELGRLLAQQTFRDYMANNFGSPNVVE